MHAGKKHIKNALYFHIYLRIIHIRKFMWKTHQILWTSKPNLKYNINSQYNAFLLSHQANFSQKPLTKSNLPDFINCKITLN
ncbi:MAG TPA: hypothetical protein DEE98_00115 [Elusimicrobia bacterium]|nr:MAG: hypothetical protein A2278_03810 [Elusimicrobia bacterium RIFOXYA12_FULL_49_49]OGS08917.1 MAG: hypothetical protein A2204_00775 [Elusimicrobia bacterium RIFOXYA1_FULL_47_7]OGS09510.1 MAG: hypothetical protein A2386_00965 [Elusimicrobia bacterium RIFOXYB1_FULL_48_9]OGS15288.1 MAG: hypothetical protein A2251_07125 [Elusimicrobia bacterium RIFOXYA2_FULL_47_53]OGS26558.1 MAG: hypothetical protein A2339_06995 [Elusimicrobia bacterium RIFOXYB12_FULL_50_12]OGS30543.1 MAG: hypothetical protein